MQQPSISTSVRLKQLGGKPKGTSWIFPRLTMYARQILRAFPDLKVESTAKPLLDEPTGFPLKHDLEWYSTWHPSWPKLYEYQKDAVNFLVSSPLHGSLLALSPGLGKTAVSIVAADLLQATNVLIVAPLSLLMTWQREITKWGLIHGTIRRGSDTVGEGWTITNYDTVVRHVKEYSKKWDLVILDESILVKSRDTQRFKRLKIITAASKKIWALSGSPTSRAVDDLWAQFHLLVPSAFPSYWRFAEEYCVIESPPWGRGVVGSKANADYREEFRDLMFVRNQRDVISLPESLYEVIDVEMLPAQKKVYKSLVKDFMADLTSEKLTVINRVAQMIRLQQIVSNLATVDSEVEDVSGKADALIDLLNSGHCQFPMIIWTHWTKSAYLLTNRLLKNGYDAMLVTGETPNRDDLIRSFTQNECDILVLSMGVGKYGLTLTNAATVVYFERSFDMDAYVQSSFRVTRIGLDHSPVVITLRCPGTIDDLVEQNLSGKAVDISKITNADLAKLLSGLGRLTP